jgi:hypothetical protein
VSLNDNEQVESKADNRPVEVSSASNGEGRYCRTLLT